MIGHDDGYLPLEAHTNEELLCKLEMNVDLKVNAEGERRIRLHEDIINLRKEIIKRMSR